MKNLIPGAGSVVGGWAESLARGRDSMALIDRSPGRRRSLQAWPELGAMSRSMRSMRSLWLAARG